jgi:hypothetical protein
MMPLSSEKLAAARAEPVLCDTPLARWMIRDTPPLPPVLR